MHSHSFVNKKSKAWEKENLLFLENPSKISRRIAYGRRLPPSLLLCVWPQAYGYGGAPLVEEDDEEEVELESEWGGGVA